MRDAIAKAICGKFTDVETGDKKIVCDYICDDCRDQADAVLTVLEKPNATMEEAGDYERNIEGSGANTIFAAMIRAARVQ